MPVLEGGVAALGRDDALQPDQVDHLLDTPAKATHRHDLQVDEQRAPVAWPNSYIDCAGRHLEAPCETYGVGPRARQTDGAPALPHQVLPESTAILSGDIAQALARAFAGGKRGDVEVLEQVQQRVEWKVED